jgi:hypothetical protein
VEFIDMLDHVARRFADHPMVVGFEIFNEPQSSADLLYAFTYDAAARLREAAPDKLIFFEPPVIRNFLDFQPLSNEPFPVSGAVYSPHIYTYAFMDPDDHLSTITRDELRPSIDNARAEATAWGTPLFIGEFGIGPDATNFDLYLRYQYDLQDEYFASSTFWLWKEESQGLWGLHDRTPDGWSERAAMIAEVSRPYFERISGLPDEHTWDVASSTLTLRTHAPVSAPNVLFVPERYELASITCNGADVTPPPARFIEITCAEDPATVVVTLTP